MLHDSSVKAVSAGSPEVVLDLYDWLPPYGETAVSFRSEGLELVVELAYDQEGPGETSSGQLAIRFSGVCGFSVISSPGLELSRVKYDNIDVSGALVLYPDSEAGRLWQGVLNHRQQSIQHYQIFFLAENKRLEVFAEEFQVTSSTS